MDKEYFGIDELSRYLSIKISTLYSMVESGKLPHYKIGRLIRFKKSEIDNWMEGLRIIPIDADMKAKEILKSLNNGNKSDTDAIIKKIIEEEKAKVYTPSNGKPGPSQGLGKEA